MRLALIPLSYAIVLAPVSAKAPRLQPGSPLIDYNGYAELTQKVRPIRAKRLLSLSTFKARAADPKVLVLDARSSTAFAAGHIKGAVNLPFPDFTEESLAKVIGKNRNRQILIYCNNNFRDNRYPVVTKSRPLALNIQTFVNLHGYGYTNVWELADAVTMDDPNVEWVRGPIAT